MKSQEALCDTVEPVSLGEIAAVRDNSGNLSLYMVVNGWCILGIVVLHGCGIERQTPIDADRILAEVYL
jgi:hypothetical protein